MNTGSNIDLNKLDHFDIKQIAESGQCFRIRELEDGRWIVPSGGKCISLDVIPRNAQHDEESHEVRKCYPDGIPRREGIALFERDIPHLKVRDDMLYWNSYFDLSRNYSAIESAIMASGDDHLIEAFKAGSGIRILKQDLWETIVSFMISQNNNIKRISGSVEKLCKLGGHGIEGFPGVYSFPEPADLDPSVFDDTALGLGYRAGCIRDMFVYTAEHPEWLTELRSAPYEDAKRILMEKKGIGPKVSDCICLFALSFVDAWPVDTHVKQLVAKYYPNGFDFERYKGFAGIIQQYLFYYEIKK